MESPFIVAPLRLEILRLARPETVVEPSIDSGQLPYSSGGRDYQTDTAFLGSEITSPPFQNTNLLLRAGWHLHWHLPQELTRGRPDGTHPVLPNRWLICRELPKGKRQHWILESDFVHPAGAVQEADTLQEMDGTLVAQPARMNGPHYRRVGRRLRLTAWLQDFGKGNFEPLTAMTGDNPAFAAFYSDCRGAFTFFDDGIGTGQDQEVTYTVTGWYARSGDDPVVSDSGVEPAATSEERLARLPDEQRKLLTEPLLQRVQLREQGVPESRFVMEAPVEGEDVKTRQDQSKEKLTKKPGKKTGPGTLPAPESARLLLYAKVVHGKNGPGNPAPRTPSILRQHRKTRKERLEERRGGDGNEKSDPQAVVAIGHTATEALSAWLAAHIARGNNTDRNSPADQTRLENQLEAILMLSDLQHRLQDQHAKFLEGRHQKGFIASHGGLHWVIRAEAPGAAVPATGAKQSVPGGPGIPAACIPLLYQLNEIQRRMDGLTNRELTLKHRLAADWHKYMLCAYPPAESRHEYPDADAVAFLLQQDSVKPLEHVRANLERLEGERAVCIAQIGQVLPPPASTGALRLVLKQEPGPRFWAPRDPVAVMEAPGEISDYLPSSIPARAGTTGPPFQKGHRVFLPDGLTGPMPAELESLINPPGLPDTFQTTLRDHQESPARPLFVEWAGRLQPLVQRETENGSRDYAEDYLSAHYAPAASSPDLVPRDAGAAAAREAATAVDDRAYSGRSLVLAHAARLLHDRLEAYLLRHFDNAWPGAPQPGDLSEISLNEARLAWLQNEPWVAAAALGHSISSPPAGSLAHTALSAWSLIRQKKILCLVLGGFNQALLASRQTVPLPIADPIGFLEYRKLADKIHSHVGGLPHSAPQPLMAFSPIRSGIFHLDRLRIIDSFGRPSDVAFNKAQVVPAGPLRVPGADPAPAGIYFPPRFLAPMRTDFRWLSAAENSAEAHSHPGTTPVCGWLLPNRLDESLAIYNAEGRPVGSIDVSGLWRSVPSEDRPLEPRDLPNPHLRRVVLHLLDMARDGSYQPAFLQTINHALEAIDPDASAATPSLALLMGRPLAIVRASLSFRMKGEPHEDHSWQALKRRLAGEQAHLTHGHERVQIPFRIGEHHMLNDGVAGYWLEKSGGDFAHHRFYAPQTHAPRHPRIVSYHESSQGGDTPDARKLVHTLSPVDPPLHLTLLLDPRGSVHLTSGVLPVKQIHLAENHFAAALKNISITFLAAPLLMAADRTEIQLPGEPGYSWSFLESTPQGWRETPPDEITPPETNAVFRPGLTLREGWLRLEPAAVPTTTTPAP